MKLFILSLCIAFCSISLVYVPATAQANNKIQKAEKALLKYLNTVCRDYTINKMSIDLGSIHQPFTIQNGVLAVVRKHKTETDDASSLFVKTSIAITEIENVFYDYYIGFVGVNNHSVKEEKSENPNHAYCTSGTMLLMHIAPVGDGEHGYDVQKKLLELVNDLKHLYSTSKK